MYAASELENELKKCGTTRISKVLKINQTFLSHFAKLFGKGTPVEIQIISHLLAVEGNLESFASVFDREIRKVGKQTLTDSFGTGAEDPVGKNQIFPGKNNQQIVHDFGIP